jgi:hypothetical protein
MPPYAGPGRVRFKGSSIETEHLSFKAIIGPPAPLTNSIPFQYIKETGNCKNYYPANVCLAKGGLRVIMW